MIISRYLTKEILGALLGVTLVLLLIFLSNQLVRYLSFAASGKVAANMLLQLMGLEVPYLLAFLLPLGLYLGLMLAYGRLYADSEMNILHACGISQRRLVELSSYLVLSVTVIVAFLVLYISPQIAAAKDKIISNNTENNLLNTLMPGRFQVSKDGKRVVYVEDISRNHQTAHNIFIADQKNSKTDTLASPWIVVSAAQGYQKIDPDTKNRFVIATNGFRYEGRPGENDYKIIEFKKYSVHVPEITSLNKHPPEETASTLALWKNYQDPYHAAELQWRLSVPLTAFILGMLAVPLSQVRPRQGRFSKIFPAIVIYIIYINLLFVARNWVEQKVLPISIGLWWVHIIMLASFILMLTMKSGKRRSEP